MNQSKPIWWRWDLALIAGSIAVGVAFVVTIAVVASRRELSPLELALFQIITLGISLGGGLFGAYKFGQNAGANKQFARSALRSVMVLYRSIAGLYDYIGRREMAEHERSAILQYLTTQMDVAQSAIADWRDIIPEDFEDVGETLEQPNARRDLANDDPNRANSG